MIERKQVSETKIGPVSIRRKCWLASSHESFFRLEAADSNIRIGVNPDSLPCRLRQCQCPQEVGKIVGQRMKLKLVASTFSGLI